MPAVSSSTQKSAFYLVISLLIASFAPSVRAQASVADEYLAGYLLCQEGENLEKANKLELAHQKYSEAGKIIDTVALNHPDWQPSVVDYRRKEIREAFARIMAQLPENSPLRAAPTASRQNYPSLPRDDRSPARLTPDSRTQRLDQIAGDSQRLLDELELKRASLEKTQSLLTQSRRAQEDLANRLRDAENRLAKGGADTDTRALKGEIARLQSELNIANDSITANDARFTELKAAHEKANTEIAALKSERDEIAAERDQLSVLLKEAENGEMTALLAENSSLKSQLKDATETIRNLTADNTAKAEEINTLKTRIKDIEGQLVKLREENDESKRRLAALADKLRKTSAQLNETVAQSREGVGEDILKENQVLQGIIKRQLMQQARRHDAKQLVMSQLAKLEIDSGTLLESVERLAGESFSLSDAEREVLESPAFRDLIDEAGGIALFHKADGDAKAPEFPEIKDNEGDKNSIGLNQDLTQFAKAANYDFMQGNFPSAEAAYQRVLDLVPDNIYVLRNLGLTKLRVGKPGEAEQLFLKAIAFDPDNDYSNFILGHYYYNQKDFDRALSAMNRVVELNPNNAKAHHYLGVICLRTFMDENTRSEIRSQMAERARAEFETVVTIDPRFADAHFNLAYLYLKAGEPDLSKARNHYRSYLTSGGRSDGAMEQNLGS
jgi:Tfp pilus assembly protein PilF/predicted  nucleic acid-binding Zn-ribbon protein